MLGKRRGTAWAQPQRKPGWRATGWLGRSLLEVPLDSTTPHRFSIYGRKSSIILSDFGKSFQVKTFDPEVIAKDEYDVFAPLAFATRDKITKVNQEEYVTSNKRIIADAVSVILRGNVGSVINISSGVVSYKSDSQQVDPSYNLYAELKDFQEQEFAAACEATGSQFINCRVFSVTGIDMTEPSKFAIGNLVEQTILRGAIELNSKSSVLRRYMDTRDLMHLLLKCVGENQIVNLESGGEEVNLIELSKSILEQFNYSTENISFKTDETLLTNNYLSNRDDFETLANKFDYPLTRLAEQISNVEKAIRKKTLR
jgi:nucleoside-diphosphate-sugar epimerase